MARGGDPDARAGRGAGRSAPRGPDRGAPPAHRRVPRRASVRGSTPPRCERATRARRRRYAAVRDRGGAMRPYPGRAAGSPAPRCTRVSGARAGCVATAARSGLGPAQHVAGAPHGMDELGLEIGVDLAAQIVDVDVDDVGEGVEADAPDVLCDERPAEHAVRVTEEVF